MAPLHILSTAVLGAASLAGLATAFVPIARPATAATRAHLMDASRVAEALGTSEKVAQGFMSGDLDPKDMSVTLLRAELDLKFVPYDDCDSIKALRERVRSSRRVEDLESDDIARRYRSITPTDVMLSEEVERLSGADTPAGAADEPGKFPPARHLPADLLFAELAARDAAAADALRGDEGSWDANDLKWRLLERREASAPKAGDDATAAPPAVSAMTALEMASELDGLGGGAAASLLRTPLEEALGGARDRAAGEGSDAVEAARKSQCDYVYEASRRAWEATEQMALAAGPPEKDIMADVLEQDLRAAGLLEGDRSVADLEAQGHVDGLPGVTLDAFQRLTLDGRVSQALADPVVERAMGLLEAGDADAFDALLEGEPQAKRAVEALLDAMEEAGVEL